MLMHYIEVDNATESIMPKADVAVLLEAGDCWADAVVEDPNVTQFALHFGESFGWACLKPEGVATDFEGGLLIDFDDGQWTMSDKPDIATYAEDGRSGSWFIITSAVWTYKNGV